MTFFSWIKQFIMFTFLVFEGKYKDTFMWTIKGYKCVLYNSLCTLNANAISPCQRSNIIKMVRLMKHCTFGLDLRYQISGVVIFNYKIAFFDIQTLFCYGRGYNHFKVSFGE